MMMMRFPRPLDLFNFLIELNWVLSLEPGQAHLAGLFSALRPLH